jgi:hypothetical protein
MTMDSNVGTISVNGTKLRMQLRDIIQIVVTFVACIGLYFALTNQTGQNSRDIQYASAERKKLWDTVEYLNQHGTAHSHETDEKQQQSIDLLGKQYDSLYHDIHDLMPKVDKIDTNVLWLMSKYLEKK